MKYRVTQAPFAVPLGFVLGLTDEQAAPRQARLRRRDDGNYDVLEPIEFKAGEEVEVVEGDLGAYGEARLTPVVSEKPATKRSPGQPSQTADAGAEPHNR